ncbi:MAG: AMP-binding protein [Thermochromatium sp.]
MAHFAGVLKSLGVEKGDRVIIYMPMVPEALVAMLGCARLGAIHSVSRRFTEAVANSLNELIGQTPRRGVARCP